MDKENNSKAAYLNEDDRLAQYIIIVVGKYLNMDENFCITKNRRADLVYGRQLCMYFIRKYTKLRLHKITSYFNNKNHATILHGIKHLESLYQVDKMVQKDIYELNHIIKFKAKNNRKKLNFHKDFYFIDFNDSVSFRLSPSKGILLAGFTNEEIETFKKYMKDIVDSREHFDTGIHIIENNNNNNNNGTKE